VGECVGEVAGCDVDEAAGGERERDDPLQHSIIVALSKPRRT